MRTFIVAAALVVASASVGAAHDTWIMCLPPHIAGGGLVSLHVTSGSAFPKFETAPESDRIAKCEWRMGDHRGSLDLLSEEKDNLKVSGRVNTAGVAVIYAEFRPQEVDLDSREVPAYMDEIGAPESVRRAWKDAGTGATFHETYTKHAKTYLRVGDSGDAKGSLGPVGFNIDFLPDRDPTSLKVGDTLTIKVIRGGMEMESFAVGTVSGHAKTTLQRTSKAGMVAIAIDAPGWWLVRGTELRRNADGTWQSDFTTLTFLVGND
jgi:uncharacterized GH25 family protein